MYRNSNRYKGFQNREKCKAGQAGQEVRYIYISRAIYIYIHIHTKNAPYVRYLPVSVLCRCVYVFDCRCPVLRCAVLCCVVLC